MKNFDQNGFYDWVLAKFCHNLLLKQQCYDFEIEQMEYGEILWIVKTSSTFGAG